MKLYHYYRSSASYRVRIALNYKKIHYDSIPVHLINNGGEQHNPDYIAKNPQGLVPTLEENTHILTQSLAIIEYLDEICPTPRLLPSNLLTRAHARSVALIIACDIHPLNNLRVLQQLRNTLNASEDEVTHWYHTWLHEGFNAIERLLQTEPRGKYPVCFGNDISIADICLIPQVYNAQRFEFSMSNYPLISDINAYCSSLSAFLEAAP